MNIRIKSSAEIAPNITVTETINTEEAGLTNEFQIIENSDSGALTYENLTPGICSIEDFPRVTFVSSGCGQVKVSNASCSVLKFFGMTEPATPPPAGVADFATLLIDTIEGDISGLTPSTATRDIFSARNNDAGTYTRNSSMFAATRYASFLTGCVVLNYRSDGTILDTSEASGGVVISPQHVLWCNHFHPQWDTFAGDGLTIKIRFVLEGGTVVDRTLIANSQPSGLDLNVGLLDSSLPEGVHVFSVFPVLTNEQITQLFIIGVPDLCVSQGQGQTRPESYNPGGIYPTTQNQMLYPGAAWLGFSTPPLSSLLPWWHKPYPGDSGTPRFIGLPDDLLLYKITSGASVSDHVAAINEAMTAADDEAIGRGTLVARTDYTVTVAPDPTL